MASGSPQYEWLKGELANSNAACQVAYFHHPLFSSGSHGNNPGVKPLWDLLYADRGELILNGHDHDYERFAPQNPSDKLMPGVSASLSSVLAAEPLRVGYGQSQL
jgi:hypothetical protein